MVNDVGDHSNHWNRCTKQDFHETTAQALLSTWDKSRTPGVQHTGKAAEDTYQSPRHCNEAAGHQLDFDIAETHAIPPQVHIVMRPNDGIGDIEEVEDRKPADQASRREIAVLCVQDQRNDTDQERDQGQDTKDHGLRVNPRGLHDQEAGSTD